jgi:uncharacterized cupredoxin-like copper-binding protein
MVDIKPQTLGFAVLVGAAFFVGPNSARAEDSTINIKLEDATSNPGMTDMKMVADRYEVHAGKVTIRATNESKALIHEVIVVADDGKPLPYNAQAGKLVESQMKKLGEVADLQPGKSDYRVFTLAPGNYLLICNQPMHFKDGMYTRLKVVPDGTPITDASNPGQAAPAPATVQTALPADEEGS